MTNTIRKRLGPLSVVATIAVLGVLAAFIALAAMPEGASAQGSTPPPPPPPVTPAPTDPPAQQTGGAPDSYVIEGPGFVDQQADQVSDYVLVVTDEDGNNPDYATHGGNMVRVRFTRHDAVPSIDEAGDIVVGCLPEDARLTDVGLQGALTASLSGPTATQCSITLDLAGGDDSFTIMATAVPNNTRLGMSLTVVGGSLVDTHTVTFLNPGTPPPPPPPTATEESDTNCYSVVGEQDENRDDLADPTSEHLNAEVGQNTVQVLNGSASVRLTVTSCQEGPAYIRFIDRFGNVFGTDVDECETCPSAAGADVVGLDSQGKLELNKMSNYTAAEALMYDQYNVVTVTRGAAITEYLSGKAGQYYQGSFRFMAPCAWGPFQVQVYDPMYKNVQYLENGMTSETVSCIPAAIADPTEFSVTVHTANAVVDASGNVTGSATVTWAVIPGSVKYYVAALDTTNPAMWEVAGYAEQATAGSVTFDNLKSGTTYLFVAIGEQANGSYSVPRSLFQTTQYTSNGQ